MTAKTLDIDAFKVGQYTTFERIFTQDDFAAFSALSLDANPLHADPEYAARTEFRRCVVPLHLVAAPLSTIAGMALPGRASLIAREEVEAIEPVFFDEPVIYSARVAEVSAATRTLGLRVIAFRDRDRAVILRAFMRVKVREEAAEPQQTLEIQEPRKKAIVTGAGGAIGSAICRALASNGWDIAAITRTSLPALTATRAFCERNGTKLTIVEQDLCDVEGLARQCFELAKQAAPSLIVHAASAPVDSDLGDLCRTNHGALRALSEAFLPQFLRQQHGRIVFIGSAVQVGPVRAMGDYAAAKAMATAWLDGLSFHYRPYNVCGLTLAPGMVDTPFSARHRAPGTRCLQPEEVADALVELLREEEWPFGFAVLQWDGLRRGHFRFHEPFDASAEDRPTRAALAVPSSIAPLGSVGAAVEDHFCRFFRLGDRGLLAGLKIGDLSDWDSLRHIEFLLDLERALGIRFEAGEIESTFSIAGLKSLVQRKVTSTR